MLPMRTDPLLTNARRGNVVTRRVSNRNSFAESVPILGTKAGLHSTSPVTPPRESKKPSRFVTIILPGGLGVAPTKIQFSPETGGGNFWDDWQ